MFIESYLYIYVFTSNSNDKLEFKTNNLKIVMQSCKFISTDQIKIGQLGKDSLVVWLNCIMEIGVELVVFRGAKFLWIGGSLSDGLTPTQVFNSGLGGGCTVVVRDVNFGGFSGNFIRPLSQIGDASYLFQRCKHNESFTILATAIDRQGDTVVKLHSCDFANTTFNIIEEHYEGTIIDETTIVRAGGMSDGTTPLSLKMTTNANAIKFLQPLVSPPITGRVKTTTEKTATIEFIHDSVIPLQNDEIWMELEVPGADAQGDIVNDKLSSILGTSEDKDASMVTWDTTGLANPNKQKMVVTFIPLKVGPITARVYLAKSSTTAYLDFKLTVEDT